MTCKKANELIALCGLGETNAAELKGLRVHIGACEQCRMEFRRVQKMLNAIRSPMTPDLPDDFWASNAAEIMQRVRARPAGHPVVWWTTAAAAVLVAVLIGSAFLSDRAPVPSGNGRIVTDAAALWSEGAAQTPQTGLDDEFERTLESLEESIDSLLVELDDMNNPVDW